jgi:hypothetical protein
MASHLRLVGRLPHEEVNMAKLSKSQQRQLVNKYGSTRAKEIARDIDSGRNSQLPPADRRRVNDIIRPAKS